MRIIIVLVALLLSACAAPRQAPKAEALPSRVPLCTGEVECGKRWIEAQEAIQNLSGMRLRMVTNSRLETFPASTYGKMTGVVTRYPVGPDTFEIRAALQCYGRLGCPDLERQGVSLFNVMLGGAIIPGVTK